MSAPTALIVQAPGTNRDGDVALALELAGAAPEIVLLGDLLATPERVRDAQMVVLPGGFSYADSLGAGRLFGLHVATALGDLLADHVSRGRPVLGICNGFQTLVRSGLLPGGDRTAALGHNDGGRFECRWVRLAARSRRCVWTADLAESGDEIHCPIAHGEGRFTCDDATLAALVGADQVALTYASPNPNGSVADIAGICDPTGVVLGLMPHPENHVVPRQHPGHRAGTSTGLGLALFRGGVAHARQT